MKNKKLDKNKIKNQNFNFIDLFSGIGGFHQALKSLGGNCVAASEINLNCIEIYKKIFLIQWYLVI
nr:DNA cytosine methyltransferase [Spiroplasma endosymbiont of Danaus chrysippus]